eukprot:GEZU01003091.1.p2 GENE.GEZU01003091.1~~GEZU01003091.1.p2  ORF type:complete len:260 (+),score=58.52 GEZU01003091.1:71-781(+)
MQYPQHSADPRDTLVDAPGEPKSMKNKILEAGAGLMQNFTPVKQIHQHVCGLHFYSGDLNRQVIAHHYCSHLNEDLHQCVIYDGMGPHAKLIGVEYIITAKLFEQLPEEEKKYWHSHRYEVKGGIISLPGLPSMAEKQVMKHLVNTYGKTWHFWQVDRGDPLPYGIPQLMMSFTQDGQAKEELMKLRDLEANTTQEQSKKQREDIEALSVLPGADHWEQTGGTALQLKEEMVPMKR